MLRDSPVTNWQGRRQVLGGRIQVRQAHLPPNSNFSSDLGHFISKILENLNDGMCAFKKISSILVISGEVPHDFGPGGRVPSPRPAAAPMPAGDVKLIISRQTQWNACGMKLTTDAAAIGADGD